MEKPKLKLIVTKHWEEEGKLINTGNIVFREKVDKKNKSLLQVIQYMNYL